MKIIKIIRAVIFIITLGISTCIFNIFMSFELDDYTYYTAYSLTKAESDKIKDLAGLFELSYLNMEGYDIKVSFATDYRYGGNVIFKVALPEDELPDFREYIEAYMNQPDSKENPYVCISEDSLQLKEGVYSMQIEYRLNKNSGLFSYLRQQDRMHISSSALVRVVAQFLLVVFFNCLIILPYKKIYSFFSSRCPHKN